MKSALQKTLFRSSGTIISIKADGSILADGYNPAIKKIPNLSNEYLCNLSLEKSRKSLFIPYDASAGTETFFVISEDGDVIQYGQNSDAEKYGAIHTEKWSDIVEIVADFHALGLKKDGTAVASGYNDFGQCNVSGWSDVDHIDCSLFLSAGIKKDGTVVISGTPYGWVGNVSSWKNIRSIFCESDYLLGIDSDGNVHYFGEKKDYIDTITGWKNVIKIVGCSDNIAALTTDGTVLAIGYDALKTDVRNWKDIVDLEFASYLLVALDKNGNVFVGGDQTVVHYSEFEHKVWTSWRDIIKIVVFNNGVLGLAKDGTIKSCLPDAFEYRDEELPKAKKWHCFSSFETIDDEYKAGFNDLKTKIENAHYKKAVNEMNAAHTEKEFNLMAQRFKWLSGIQDSDLLAEKCLKEANICREAEQCKTEQEKAALINEKNALKTELSSLHGLFTGKRRRKLEEQIAEIDRKLKKYSNI